MRTVCEQTVSSAAVRMLAAERSVGALAVTHGTSTSSQTAALSPDDCHLQELQWPTPMCEHAMGNHPGGGGAAGPAASPRSSVRDDIAESGSDPLVGGRVMVLERLEVIKHPVQLGRREPRRPGVTLERLDLPDQIREVLQRVPLIGGEVLALAKAQVANDHIERLHHPTQLASVAGYVFDDAPLELGIGGADV